MYIIRVHQFLKEIKVFIGDMLENPEVPTFLHDCNDCVFLGHMLDSDMYFCDMGNNEGYTVIARKSSVPEDYISGLEMAPYVPELDVALSLANALGLTYSPR